MTPITTYKEILRLHRLRPTLARVHGPGSLVASELVGIDVARSYVRQAIA